MKLASFWEACQTGRERSAYDLNAMTAAGHDLRKTERIWLSWLPVQAANKVSADGEADTESTESDASFLEPHQDAIAILLTGP